MTTPDFARERLLLSRLREVLPAEAQTIVWRRFDELLALMEEPRCAEAQADGVPCPDAEGCCEHCGRALVWVRRLREEIARSAG